MTPMPRMSAKEFTEFLNTLPETKKAEVKVAKAKAESFRPMSAEKKTGKILALDLSTTCTGFCFDSEKGMEWVSVKPKGKSREERIFILAQAVVDLVFVQGIETIVAEDMNYMHGPKANLTSILAAGELRGAINFYLQHSNKPPLEYINLSTIKQVLKIRDAFPGIKGQVKKEHVREWLKRKGIITKNEDESDACAVYLAFKTVQSLPQEQKLI